MIDFFRLAACLIISYLLGNLQTGILLSKLIKKDDIRMHGSGSSGATNMLRTYGKKFAAVTFVLDILKGTVAVLLSRYIGGDWGVTISGIAVVLGHSFPAFFGFKGGKGVATSLGVIFAINFWWAMTGFAIAIIVAIITGFMSLGSMLGTLVAVSYLVITQPWSIKILAVSLMIISIFLHRENIKRLIKGTESKTFKKKDK